MRIFDSIRWFLLIPVYPAIGYADRLRVGYYYLKSLLNRFLLKRQPSNKRLSISFSGEPLYFRDNWFDPRSVYTAFSNDYTALDKGIFKGMKTFVDVGANIGLVSRCARMSSPGCEIFCFEPLEENAAICKLNNPGASVEVSAVGPKPGKKLLLVDSSGFMASSLKFGYGQQEKEVRVISLDGYFPTRQEPIDLVKIDVEGMECDIVLGGKKTLSLARKVVAEVHSKELLSRMRKLMEPLGFIEKGSVLLGKDIYAVYWTHAVRD
jgi:FkbM family methyltransferase